MNRRAHFAVNILALLLSASCASTSSNDHRAPREPPPVPSAGVTDPSYDWHVLVLAPFGMLLKDSPIPLHEVLLFPDQAHGTDAAAANGGNRADVESKDCFTIDRAPPRFVGQQPDQYLLCFDHDRLNRIEASVRLPAGEAPQVFARACALWLKSTLPAAGSGNACEGRDGGISFSGHLSAVPGDTAALSMTLGQAPHEPHAP